jgi:hypothetical protein
MRAKDAMRSSGAFMIPALFTQGCCCFGGIGGGEAGDGTGWFAAVVAYTLLPVAVALTCYERQKRKYQPVWVARWTAIPDAVGGAYRTADVALESVDVPPVVRFAGCLGFIHAGASFAALFEAAHVLEGSLIASKGPTHAVSSGVWMAAGLLALVFTLDVGAVSFGNAVLACKVSSRSTRGIVVMQSLVLISLGLFEWGPLLRDLAALMHQPSHGPPIFGPNGLTIFAGVFLVAWPVLGLATGVAFVLAAPALAEGADE